MSTPHDGEPRAQADVDQFAETGYAPTGYAQAGYPQAGGYPSYYPQSPSQSQRGGGSGRAVMLGVAIACIIGLVVAAVVIWLKVARSGSGDTQAQPGVAQQQAQTVTSVVADPEADAGTKLSSQAAADAVQFRGALNNQWVAQISAKRPGLFADGRNWNNQAILAEFNSARGRYPQVRLLNSSEWPVFSDTGWWVTVSAQSFAGSGQALSWCAANGMDRDHCFAKFISSTQGPNGSTVYQR